MDTDLQDIIKEISIMQQCDSPYVVKYYGSYFKNTDLWIVMEYCGAGSVSDIMRSTFKSSPKNILPLKICFKGYRKIRGLNIIRGRINMIKLKSLIYY